MSNTLLRHGTIIFIEIIYICLASVSNVLVTLYVNAKVDILRIDNAVRRREGCGMHRLLVCF